MRCSSEQPDPVVAGVLARLLPPHALRILDAFPEAHARDLLALGSRVAASASGRSTPATLIRASVA
jgi:hypothetical protein